jgi:hypothetical protein
VVTGGRTAQKASVVRLPAITASVALISAAPVHQDRIPGMDVDVVLTDLALAASAAVTIA